MAPLHGNRSVYLHRLTKGAAPHSFPNYTINGEGLSFVAYLPDDRHGYYRSTRYDWGSMVGRVELRVPNGGGKITVFADTRPRPHRPGTTDHVLGVASEFGCGVRGTVCRAPGKTLVANGVLGYGDAQKGGTFLKLGVGKLLRPAKAVADGFTYNFSYPYKFAAPPQWEVSKLEDGTGVVYEQRVSHKRWGWAVRRQITSCGKPDKKPALCIDLKVTNIGEMVVRTPYTVGNAFNLAAGPSTGKRFGVTFYAAGAADHYDHGSSKRKSIGAVQLRSIADVKLQKGSIGQSTIVVNRSIGEGEHASVNFNVTSEWDGRFLVTMPAAKGWNLLAKHTMWRDKAIKASGWYGFNVRISRRAVAPRPFVLLDLEPGQSVDLSHKYEFEWKPARI